MKNLILKKKNLLILLFIFVSIFLTSCGMSKEEKEVEKLVETNSEIIMQSKIVNPFALINSFNTDLDRALVNFNAQRIAIKVYPNEILQGTLVIPNSDGTQTKEECLYVQFDEAGWITDEKQLAAYKELNPSRTSLVCSINKEDYGLLNYTNPTEYGTQVTTYYLVGNLSAVVGNEKYNLFAKDCRLIPAPTTYPINVPVDPEISVSKTLDVSSSEDITYTGTTVYLGQNDYNNDGLADVLNIAYQNAEPSSGFEKIIYNGIIKKITTDLSSVVKVNFDEIGCNFKVNYPVTVDYPNLIPSSALDGSDVYVLDFLADGKDKSAIDYFNNKALFEEMLPTLVANPLYMESQNILLSVGATAIQPFTVKLLDGTETTTLLSDRVTFKSLTIDGLGNITGDIYVKSNLPCTHYYKSQFRIVDSFTIEEVKSDLHDFYDYKFFEDYDIFQVATDGYKLKKDIAVALDKKVFVSYKLDSKTSKDLITGKGTTKTEDTVNIIKCNTGEYINFLSVEKVEDQYWLNAEYLYGDGQKKTCYIPLEIGTDIVSPDKNIQILGTSYKLDDLFYFGE